MPSGSESGTREKIFYAIFRLTVKEQRCVPRGAHSGQWRGHLGSSTAEEEVKKPLGGDWQPPRLALGVEDPLKEDAALPFSTVDEVSHCAVFFKLP